MAYSVVTKTYLFGGVALHCLFLQTGKFCHNTVCHRAFSLLSPTARLTLLSKCAKIFKCASFLTNDGNLILFVEVC